MSPLNPLAIDVGNAEVVAFASTDRDGTSRNWTELGIYYVPSPCGRCFVADAKGCTRVPGQTTRRRAVYVGTIDRALEFFDDSELADAVRLQARDWMDRNTARVAQAIKALRGGPAGFLGQGGLIGALRWLYEGQQQDVTTVRESNLVDAFAEDFDVPGRTVRESLKNEREGKELPSWCRAFIASLMHFDRTAFRAMKGGA